MFESLFQLLFSYRPVIFQQGEFRFNPPAGTYVAVAVGMAVLAAAVAAYGNGRSKGTLRDRLILWSLRLTALVLALMCLFRPVLVVRAAVPQQNFVGVVLDDSRSMQIADWGDQPRSAFVQREFGGPDRALLSELAKRYVVRVFRFSSNVSRAGSGGELSFNGTQTKLGEALEGARRELAGLPVAGLVLVTDGADTSEGSLSESLLALKAESLPVFPVGVGRETLSKDIEITRATAPKTVLKDTSLLLDVIVTQHGYAGQTVTVDVQDEGRIVGSQQVQLPADGPAVVRVRATASDPGPRTFSFRVAPQAGEVITQNNVRTALIDVQDRKEKILYYEGEPRFEFKFLRRAVEDDKNLQVVGLQRTADKKFYRIGVDNPEELVAGFPQTREELFAYRGLVLGSVEAGAFSGEQLRMIADFVDQRGGGFLMLGGARAFSEGGFAGTPVADILPVAISRTGAQPAGGPPFVRLKVAPTRAGSAQAVTHLADTEAASAAKWNELPDVSSVNDLTAVKPGATVLLNGTDDRKRTRVVLANQRYGRGKALAFSIQDSWLWQMHATVPVEDQTHEHFWRQLLRWLVDAVPGSVDVRMTDRVEPGEPVTVTADVVDGAFVNLNDAGVVAHVQRPGGATLDVPLQWTGEHDGEYRGTFVSVEPGPYEVRVEATRAGKTLGTGIAHLQAAPSDAEFFNATMHGSDLRRIAEQTGGRFYTPETVSGLTEDLRYSGRGVTTVEERDLWHMPIVLLALVGLVCAEWGYRRAVGLM